MSQCGSPQLCVCVSRELRARQSLQLCAFERLCACVSSLQRMQFTFLLPAFRPLEFTNVRRPLAGSAKVKPPLIGGLGEQKEEKEP